MIQSLNDTIKNGAVAQLGEHLLCKQGVTGSIPDSSTKVCYDQKLVWVAKKLTRIGPWRRLRSCSRCAWSTKIREFPLAEPAARKARYQKVQREFLDHRCSDYPRGKSK